MSEARGSHEGGPSDGAAPMEGVTQTPPGLGGKRGRANAEESFQGEPQDRSGAPERKELTLQDIMDTLSAGFARSDENAARMQRELGEVKRDTSEAKTLAAKATTLASETKESVTTLERRVAALEAGKPLPRPGQPQGLGGRPPNLRQTPKSDFDQIGGEEGDTIVVGGFRNWADKEERTQHWNEIRAGLPQELSEAISEVVVPASQCSIVIVKIHKHPKGPNETRANMRKWGEKFRELALTHKADDEETPRKLYASPSKPFTMRQRNAKLAGLLEAFKKIAAPDQLPNLRAEMPTGRIFLGRTMLAEREPDEDDATPIMTTVTRLWPGTTAEQISQALKEAMNEKDRIRKGA